MDELLQADPALFACALHFTSREGHGFVLVRHTGGPAANPRTWPRWPLRRLFSTRRACVVTNPATGERGLAIPFRVGKTSHVIVAPLSTDVCDAAQQTFLDTLQSVTLANVPPPLANEHIPRFVWLGRTPELANRVNDLVNNRGWSLLAAPTFGHVLMMLESDRVDIALVEAAALKDELSSLRALRHAARVGDAPIVFFSDKGCDSEIETLVDCCLPSNVGETELLRALKEGVALVSRTRAHALRASVERMEDELRSCADYPELAQKCAEAALALGADAVSVMLADEAGGVYAAHLPPNHLLGDHWPTPFMTGETITHPYAGDAFYQDAFDDAEYARRVRELHAVSAAALPISHGARIVGTLLAFSTKQPMFQAEFDAFAELCKRTGHLASTLRAPVAARGPWQRATIGEAMVEIFDGELSRASTCMRTEGMRAAIVMLEEDDRARTRAIAEELLADPHTDLRQLVQSFKQDARGILLAIVEDDRVYFACEGLPVPLRVPLSGPVPAVRFAQTCEAGTIALDAQSLTLLYCSEFAAQVQTAQLVAAVQRGLRSSRATLARSLPRLGSRARKLTFACITMLSSDVDLPRPPAFV